MTYPELISNLSKIKSFVGSTPHYYSLQSFTTQKDVETQLMKRLESFEKLSGVTGCGELTSNERKEFKLLKNYFGYKP